MKQNHIFYLPARWIDIHECRSEKFLNHMPVPEDLPEKMIQMGAAIMESNGCSH